MLAAALALPGVAWSAQCDSSLTKGNDAITNGPKATVTAEDLAQAKTLLAEASAKLASSDDVGCVAIAGQALELLDIAEGD